MIDLRSFAKSKPTTGTTLTQFRMVRRSAKHIFKVPPEVTWYIFSFAIVDDDDFVEKMCEFRPSPPSALARARHLSQVCSSWRQLLLASPSLWADAIELNYLNQKNSYWRNEVIRRTGNLPLSIVGKVEEGQNSTEFFLDVLSSKWPRIRRLHVFVSDNVACDERWSVMEHPACNLELLYVSFFETPATGFLTTDSVLFAKNAPRLRLLRFQDAEFNLAGPWISQLRELCLRENMAGDALFRALLDMLALEVLEIDQLDVPDLNEVHCNWPVVTLPRLKSLVSWDWFQVSNLILQHIIPPLECNMFVESTDNGPLNLTSSELAILFQSVVRYFKSYSARGETSLSVTVSDVLVEVDNIRDYFSNPVPPARPHFRFDIEIDFAEASYAVPFTIFRALSFCDLTTITTLHLDLVFDEVEPSLSDLTSLLKALSRVEILQTQSNTLKLLVDIHHTCPPILPSLHTIIFDTGDEIQSDVVMRFLNRRRDVKLPIKVFDLKSCTSFGQALLLFLDGIDDLKVLWNQEVREQIEEGRHYLD